MFEKYYLDKFAQGLAKHTYALIHAEEDNLLQYLIPIYLENEKGFLEHIGTSILLKIEPENYFLITAAHVLDHKIRGSLMLVGDNGLVSLTSDFTITRLSQGTRDEDKFDFGFTKLNTEIIKGITPYKFCSISHVVTNFNFRVPRLYTFMGYPNSKNKVWDRVKPKAHSLNTLLASEDEYETYGIDSNTHIAIRFENNKLVDSGDKKNVFPKPIGLSGGAVWGWYIYDDSKVGNIKVIPKRRA